MFKCFGLTKDEVINIFCDRCYVLVNSKPGKPLGNFLIGQFPNPGHKESVKPRPLGQINRAKTPPPGQLFSKMQQKTPQNMRQKL